MPKNGVPLIFEKNQKLINTSKPQKIILNVEIIDKEETPKISNAIIKKNSVRLSENKNKQSSKKNIVKNNQQKNI